MNEVVKSTGLKFRWINGQCLELILPNGKHILTDPFFPSPTCPSADKKMMESSALDIPFGIDDIEGADYIIINHSHGDHIFKLEEIAQKFDSIVIMHSALATDFAKLYDIPMTNIYPVDFNSRYYFDGFTLDTFHGTHHPVKSFKSSVEKKNYSMVENREDIFEWNVLGGLYNMNYVITTPQDVKLGFAGGNIDGDYEIFAQNRPTILFRNKLHSSKTEYDVAKDWAQYQAKCNIPIMVPMHHEKWFVTKPGYTEQLVADMNEYLESWGSPCRVLNPERTKWYSLDISVNLR